MRVTAGEGRPVFNLSTTLFSSLFSSLSRYVTGPFGPPNLLKGAPSTAFNILNTHSAARRSTRRVVSCSMAPALSRASTALLKSLALQLRTLVRV